MTMCLVHMIYFSISVYTYKDRTPPF